MGRADELLERIVTTLRANSNVQAVWLSGSRGRGTNDEFSDIDLWVAVEDSAMISIVADPVKFIHSIVPTIMEVNAPAIAPPEGAFVGSWVPVEDVFVQVDWYLTQAANAQREADTHIVFGDVPVVRAVPSETTETAAHGKVQDNLILTLVMICNLVKSARRGNHWRAVDHARHADRCLIRADVLLHSGAEPDYISSFKTYLPDQIPGDTSAFISTAQYLLDLASNIAQRAELHAELLGATTALQQEIHLWRASEWLPAEEYYRRLPRRYMGAGVLITDADNRVLLVETTYKTHFEIPGGVSDAGESPSVTAAREVREELGITIPIGPLLVMDHRSQPLPKGDAMMFIYDGGMVESLDQLQPDEVEIKQIHFVPIDGLHGLVTDRMAARIRAALRARNEQRMIEIAAVPRDQ